jgi:hypothetical protein
MPPAPIARPGFADVYAIVEPLIHWKIRKPADGGSALLAAVVGRLVSRACLKIALLAGAVFASIGRLFAAMAEGR